MSILAGALVVAGVIFAIIGFIWILIEAFKESVWWGLGSLFINVVALIFVLMHWDRAKKPFLIWLGGGVLVLVGGLLMNRAAG